VNSTLGQGLVLAGLGFATFGALVGLVTGLLRRESALPWVQRSVFGFAACMGFANLVMVKALLEHDFSVKYVATVGSRATPVVYTIVSLWSALEGSILFWGAIMGAYLAAFAWTYRREHGRYMQLSLGVMSAVAVFFAFLIAGPANPFVSLPNPPLDGPGPNPLLQNHPLMIIHPPFLYLGFVGMTVPFGIAAGALLRGELGDAWLVPLRKWTLVPWLFLSIGIILGGWWAYAVLGWGGYWAWDPVENASFLPWLTATAFLHQTFVLERKKTLKVWAMVLALSSFSLTIIGTFMTRSGVFNSVHAFSQSDIGPTFLVFIAVVLVFSVLLLATRSHLLVSESSLGGTLSRSTGLVVATVLFSVFMLMVLNGTLFPLITEALEKKRISVGEPYFNTFAVPFGMLLLFLMGVGPTLPWNATGLRDFLRQIAPPAAVGLATGVLCVGFGVPPGASLVTFALAGFVTASTARELFLPARQRMSDAREGFSTALLRSASRAPRRFGGYVVHLAVVVIVVGITASHAFKTFTTATLNPGGTMRVGRYEVRFDGLSSGQEPHRTWIGANLTLTAPDGTRTGYAGAAGPRLNNYERSNDPIGSPLVHETVARDIYVSLLAFDQKTGTASFNAWDFPLVGWIWYAIPLLVLGVGIALWPQRRHEGDALPGAQVGAASAAAPASATPPAQAQASAVPTVSKPGPP
jgi:cytochrome c-type biogenesis protein CcmF